jgi:hypothetical protein
VFNRCPPDGIEANSDERGLREVALDFVPSLKQGFEDCISPS